MVALSSNAVTLTYDVSPHPFSYQTLFAMLITNVAALRQTPKLMDSWLSTIWGTIDTRRVKVRQSGFVESFARQLEVTQSAQESSHVIVSAACALISGGELHWGLLWLTPYGLYFRTTATSHPIMHDLHQDTDTALEKDDWEDAAFTIKEALPFQDIVAFLPSVALATEEDGAPFVSGIPNPMVAPSALQVFTSSPKQIYQFVYIHRVALAPPSHLTPKGVLTRHEYDAVRNFPNGLDGSIVSAITERLWETRLTSLRLPLLRNDVQYAPAH